MEIEGNSSTSILNETLQKVAKGARAVFIGSIVSIVFAFISRILIAKYYTQEKYGIFSLGYTVLFIFATVGTLGLQDGVAKQIAYYKGKGDSKEIITGVISYSLPFGMVTAIALFLIVFISSNFISIKIFGILNLNPIVNPIKSAGLIKPVKRPKFSALKNKKLEKLGLKMRRWGDTLKDYLIEKA